MYQIIVKDFKKKKQMPKKLRAYVCIACGCTADDIVNVRRIETETSVDYEFTIRGKNDES